MGDDTEDFVYDTFRDQPDKLPQDVVYDKFRLFVKEYGNALADMEATMDESVGEVWDPADTVGLNMAPDDQLTIEEVLGERTKESKLFYKVMLVLTSLMAEIGDLCDEAKNKLLPALSTYGEQPEGKSLQDGEAQLTFGRMLPLFMDTWNFCDRAYNVVENLVRQLASVYSDLNRKRPERRGLAAYQQVHFNDAWRSLGDMLAVLITLDEMIRQNDAFQQTCTVFKRMMKNVRNQPDKYDIEAQKAKRFGFLIDKLESSLLDDLIFQNCLDDRTFDDPGLVSVRDNLIFMHEFDFQLRELYTYIRKGLGMKFEIDKRNMYVGLCGLYVLYYSLFRDKLRGKADDKKFFKSLFEVHKTVPVVHLYGNTTFAPAEWLARRVPDITNSITRDPQKDHHAACRAILQTYEYEPLAATVHKHYQDVMVWASRFESRATTQKPDELVAREGYLILQGVHHAYEVSVLVKGVLGTHVAVQAALSVRKVLLLCKCIEMLKAILCTFHRKTPVVGNLMSILSEYVSYNLQRQLMPFKKRLKDNLARLDDGQVDQLSALELMLRVLHGSPTRNSVLVLKTALSIVCSKTGGLMKDQDFDFMRQYLRRLEIISGWQPMVWEACDCSWLYWHRQILPTYLQALYKEPPTASSIVNMFMSLHDCSRILLSANHLDDKRALFESYVKEIKDEFNACLVKPLCTEIENSLRLSIHSKVLGETKHSLADAQHKDLQQLLDLASLRLFGEKLCVRAIVEHYLESQFYNLTAMAPHDWKTYEEMRALAKERYNMDLTEAHLPGQTLDQGLDILEVTRSIHLFVTRYTYNLNNQIFIERPRTTESKHLHTVNVTHIANSIRTHGTGIMTTTVNFVYQFLTKKFFVFSKFLYDDHVKSRLLKDLKWFGEKKDELQNLWPVKRAEKFVKDIRRLGTDDQQQSYLDQFRKLITEIGNALGYVRMVRTGGMRAISRQISFVPALDEIPEFAAMLEEANFRQNPDDSDEEVEGELAETTRQAAANLDAVLQNQSKRFSDGSDYFKLLEDVFKEEMNSEKNAHLQNFYVIVPPLTLSFVDYMIGCKDRLTKKGKEASFTDDGFALGVSFILKLLRNQEKFESLHWFSSVAGFYEEEKEKIQEQVQRATALEAQKEKEKKKGKKGDVSRVETEEAGEITTLSLTQNRIRGLKREFELMYYAFRSAKVFFKDKKEVEEEDEPEDDFDEDELDEA
eukprot:TRINITY_DN50728_c0_g1_i1.p1 TRINITY_DN50728_c0_g1~~TRINITY_DN50728_c0_g1_i1.p1  ORF type:complete len:1241 (+),score=561.49 TRINITY_DN50728_c0_g1_i1:104-3724(+)